jgi:O-antigen/teichoic acid export membrane protein
VNVVVQPIITRLGRQAGWLLAANLVVFGLAFAQGLVLARSLGPAGFGTLALILAITDVAQQLLSSRVWEAATTYVTRFRSNENHVAAAAIIKLCIAADGCAAMVASGIVFVVAPWLATWFVKDPSAVEALRVYALVPLVMIPVATGRALLRIADRFRWLSLALVAEGVVRLLLVVAVVTTVGGDLQAVVWAYLVAATFGATVTLWLIARAWAVLGLAPWRSARLSAVPGLRSVIRFMVYSNVSGTFRLLSGKADVLLVGWFADPAAVGMYRLARTLADPLVALSDPVYQAVYPEMARLVHEGERTDVARLASTVRTWGWRIVVPVGALVTVAATWFIPTMFGESYADAVPLTQILVWQMVWLPYIWVPGLLLALGSARTVTALTAADGVAYLALLLVLVPSFGVTGAAVATVLRFAIWAVAAAELGRRAIATPQEVMV